jgi:hypothetical protein
VQRTSSSTFPLFSTLINLQFDSEARCASHDVQTIGFPASASTLYSPSSSSSLKVPKESTSIAAASSSPQQTPKENSLKTHTPDALVSKCRSSLNLVLSRPVHSNKEAGKGPMEPRRDKKIHGKLEPPPALLAKPTAINWRQALTKLRTALHQYLPLQLVSSFS